MATADELQEEIRLYHEKRRELNNEIEDASDDDHLKELEEEHKAVLVKIEELYAELAKTFV